MLDVGSSPSTIVPFRRCPQSPLGPLSSRVKLPERVALWPVRFMTGRPRTRESLAQKNQRAPGIGGLAGIRPVQRRTVNPPPFPSVI